jgi:hypothetical protein
VNPASRLATDHHLSRHVDGHGHPLTLARQSHDNGIGRQARAIEADLQPPVLADLGSGAGSPVGGDERLFLDRAPLPALATLETIAGRRDPQPDGASGDDRFVARGGHARGEAVGILYHPAPGVRDGEHDGSRNEADDRQHDHQFQQREALLGGTRHGREALLGGTP